MKTLVLLYTQAEAGAPGYLSRQGEDSAENLAQTLFQFAQETLKCPLEDTYEVRVQSLKEDLRWKAFRAPAALPQAIRAAQGLFADLLLFSGEHTRSLKTAERVAQLFALPVCVDARLDKSPDDIPPPSAGTLAEGIDDLIRQHISTLEIKPRCLCIATSERALITWLKSHMDSERWSEFQETLKQSTANDSIPAVYACGLELTESNTPRWLIE